MAQIPYWLNSFGRPGDYTFDPSNPYDPNDDATTGILAELLGSPAGYIDKLWLDMLSRRSYDWLVKVDINGVEYGASKIVEFSIDHEVGDQTDGFTIGSAVISSCTLRLRTTDAIPPNAKVVPYVALSLESLSWDEADDAWLDADYPWDGSGHTEWMPLGTFYVDNRKRIDDILVLTCLDGLVYADIAYVSQLDYPATMQDVWAEVCDQAGLDYDASVQINPSYILNAAPTNYSCRQVMQYIAGAHGACVRMSRTGEVGWRVYRADDQPAYELTESDYVRVSQTNPLKTYKRLVVVYDEDEQLAYEAGEGTENETLYMTNPLMTQAMVDALHAQIDGLSYMPIEMDVRGYPHMLVGERIFYVRRGEVYQSLILRQTYSFKGGLFMTLDAPSVSEQESEFGIDGSLTAAVKRLNQNAVKFGKPYYGVTHSRTEGIVVQREDGAAKAVFNADELSFYRGSQRVLYFDAANNRYVFGGHLQAASGTFTGELQGGSITIGSGNNVFRADTQGIWAGNSSFNNAPFRVNMQGQLTAVNANVSGTITAISGRIGGWTIQNNALYSSTTTYPRVVIDPSNNEVTFYASTTKYIRIGSINFYHGGSEPFIDIWNGSDYVSISLNDFYLTFEGSRQARFNFPSIYLDQTVWVDFNNLRDQMSGDSIWDIVSDLEDQIDGKLDASDGLTTFVDVFDGVNTSRLFFIDGQLVGII